VTSILPATLPADLSVTVLKKGPWGKADILRFSYDGGEAILKDFSAKSAPVRWLGRRQLRSERRALDRLAGVPGVPAVLGALPPFGLFLQPMRGEAITRWRRRPRPEIAPMLERLDRLVGLIHARGVAHLDLRKRDNILVAADGTPSVIDFNASVAFRTGSAGARLLFPILRAVDRSALLKWKALLTPEALTTDERRRHRRMSLLRRLWIFN
jgi:tRNA A-37 threonylcarbamoyl transferase component Bud32